jgi:hypothetical protein
MSERVYKLLDGSELLVSEEVIGLRLKPESVPLTTNGDGVIDDVLDLLDKTVDERDRLRKELEEAQKPTTKLERVLLKMWHSQGIKEIYKYKHRIKIYRREGLEGYDLFNDITCGLLFREVEDTANYRDATPEDFKVSVEFLLGQEGEGNQNE